MDDADESLEARTERVRDLLAVVKNDPALDEDVRPIAEAAVKRLDTVLDEGIVEDPPDNLIDAEPIDPPDSDGPRSLDGLFETDDGDDEGRRTRIQRLHGLRNRCNPEAIYTPIISWCIVGKYLS